MAIASAKTPAAEVPQRPYYSDIGPRVGVLEQGVTLLKNEMGDVKDSLRSMAQAQKATSDILLRMEAAAAERERVPKTAWWTYVMSASASIALLFGVASGFSWFFEARFSQSIAPISATVTGTGRDLAERQTLLERRLSLIESAFSWAPSLKLVVPGPDMRN
jgi:hypothetical protein